MFPMPQECVLSYIYRINMVLAPCKMPNVIDKRGRWSGHIILPHQYQKILIKHTDYQVFNLLLESGVIEYQDDILKSPVDYTRIMAAFLKGERVKKGFSSQLKYCSKCIKEFIEKYGFAYFKADWTHYITSDNCSVHRMPLYIIDSGNRKDALKAIGIVMMGKHSQFCKSLSDSPYYREISDDYYISKSTEAKLPHLASCLKSRLKAWLLIDDHTFPDSLVSSVRCASHDSFVRSIKTYVFIDYVFKAAYIALHHSDYSRFHTFWERYAEIYTFYCGVIKKQGLSGKIAKLKGSNCSKCRDIYCPANLAYSSSLYSYRPYKYLGERITTN